MYLEESVAAFVGTTEDSELLFCRVSNQLLSMFFAEWE